MSATPAEHNIHLFPTASLTATVAAQAGAQSILEAAALAGQTGRSSPEWCTAYPAAMPSSHGLPAENQQLPGPISSGVSYLLLSTLMKVPGSLQAAALVLSVFAWSADYCMFVYRLHNMASYASLPWCGPRCCHSSTSSRPV